MPSLWYWTSAQMVIAGKGSEVMGTLNRDRVSMVGSLAHCLNNKDMRWHLRGQVI